MSFGNTAAPGEVSIILGRVRNGDAGAWDLLYRIAFLRLRLIAGALLSRERPGHTLQPTALVAESFLKLYRLPERLLGREHFFSLSARAMSQVLIDHARRKRSRARIEPFELANLLTPALTSELNTVESIAVRTVFAKLRRADKIAAESLRLRYIKG